MVHSDVSLDQIGHLTLKRELEQHLYGGLANQVLEAARGLCEMAPQDDEAWRLLGKIELANNHFTAAADAYCHAIRLNPNQDNELFRSCLINSVEHDVAPVTDVASIAISRFPDDPTINAYASVIFYVEQPNVGNAEILRQALKREPNQWGSFYHAYANAMVDQGWLIDGIDDLIQAEATLETTAPLSLARSSALYHAAHLLRALEAGDRLRLVLTRLNSINPALMPQLRPLWDWMLEAGNGSPHLQEINGFAESCNSTIAGIISGAPLPETTDILGITFLVKERYRFFAVDRMSREALTDLSGEGISADFLAVVSSDESLYLNAISPPAPGKAWRHDVFVSPRVRDILDTLDARRKTVLSPFTGKPVASTSMLASEVFTATDSGKPFIVTQWAETDMCMTDSVWIIPHLEIVLYLAVTAIPERFLRDKVSHLYEHAILNRHALKQNIEAGSAYFVVSQPEIPHIGHYIWNSISGLSPFFRYCSKDRYPKEFAKFDNIKMVGDVHNLYEDFYEGNATATSFANLAAADRYIVEKNCILLTLKDNYITEELANRVTRAAYSKADPTFVDKARAFRALCYPLVLITLRLGNRSWMEQRDAWPKILKNLADEFDCIGFVLDGINGDTTQGWTHGMMSVNEEMALASEIIAECGNDIPIFNSIGCTADESIVIADMADGFVAPVGAGMAKYRWVANLPGVAFSNKSFSDPGSRDGRLYDSYREHARKAIHVDSSMIKDCHEPSFDPGRANFSMDWRVLHETIREFLLNFNSDGPLRHYKTRS